MIGDGDTVLVAVSGGPDSTALLHALRRITGGSASLHVIHVDHRLRPESAAEARAVRRLAAGMELDCRVETVPVRRLAEEEGLSVETAARQARYRAFERAAEDLDADRVALGHHRQDQAETVLMNLLRGSGLRGLRGMPPARGRYIRPLIACRRGVVADYCAENDLPVLRDPTNTSLKPLRNKIRHQLLPLLESEYNEAAAEHLARTADVVGPEVVLLRERTERLLDDLRDQSDGRRLALAPMRALAAADQRRLLRLLWQRATEGDYGLGYEHTERCRRFLTDGPSNGSLDLPAGRHLWKTYRHFGIETAPETTEAGEQAGYLYRLPVPGTVHLKEPDMTLSADIVTGDEARHALAQAGDGGDRRERRHLVRVGYLQYNKVQLPFAVRNRRPGDRFRPLGMDGHKKLKDFFIDEKIEPARRERWPLVLSGDTIVWVVGRRIHHDFRVTDETERCVRITARPPAPRWSASLDSPL